MSRSENESVFTIDCQYIRPQFAAAYLIVEDGRATFVENNTTHAVPLLLEALKKQGLTGEQVDYLIITHVHLDHAGGTSALLKHCPQAVVLAQERAAPHIIDPTRLIKGSQAVYGQEQFKALYGDIEPIPAARVRVVTDGEVIRWGSRQLKFIYTLGHAKHHMCIHDSGSNGIFTGDSFGLACPEFQRGDDFFIFPSTSPSDFDPEEAQKALEKIMATGASRAYLTHFGILPDMAEGFRQMSEYIGVMREMRDAAADLSLAEEQIDDFCFKKMELFFQTELARHGLKASDKIIAALEMDIKLNAMGVALAARRLRS